MDDTGPMLLTNMSTSITVGLTVRGVEKARERQIEKLMAESEFIFHLKLLTDTLHFSNDLNLSFYVSRQCTKSFFPLSSFFLAFC